MRQGSTRANGEWWGVIAVAGLALVLPIGCGGSETPGDSDGDVSVSGAVEDSASGGSSRAEDAQGHPSETPVHEETQLAPELEVSAPDADVSDLGSGPSEGDVTAVSGDVTDAGAPVDDAGDAEGSQDTDAETGDRGVQHDAGTHDGSGETDPGGTSDAAASGDAGLPPQDVGPPPALFDPSEIDEEPDAFPFAVQAADATPEGALLWTRVTHPVEGLHVVVYDADGEVGADAPAEVADGGFVEVDVAGLQAWTDYWYTFVADEPAGQQTPFRSPIGRFRTAPAPADQPAIVFGATSCNNTGFLTPKPLAPAADAQLDLFLMAGDTVYADGSSSVGDYREVWEEAYENDEMRQVHASTSFLYTWDDHEVDNNWNPESLSPTTIANAVQVFYEHAPVRRTEEAPYRLWRSYTWGKTAEFFVLDARGERKPSTMNTDVAEYLSVDQMAWLQAGLLASEATFKVILHGVAFTDMPWQYPAADDRWEGYDAQRAQLIDTLEEVDGVIFVTGDFHFGSIGTIEPPGNLLDYIPEVLVGPVSQFGNPGMYLLSLESQFSYLTLTNNYTRFTADPMADPPEVTVEFIAGDGDVFHSQTIYF